MPNSTMRAKKGFKSISQSAQVLPWLKTGARKAATGKPMNVAIIGID